MNIVAIQCRTNTGELIEVPVSEFIAISRSTTVTPTNTVPKSNGKEYIASGISVDNNGIVSFHSYTNSGIINGTAQGLIAHDSNGKLISVPLTIIPKQQTQSSTTDSVVDRVSTERMLPIFEDENGNVIDSTIFQTGENYSVGGKNPFWKWTVDKGSINIDQNAVTANGYRLNGKLVLSYDSVTNKITIGNATYNVVQMHTATLTGGILNIVKEGNASNSINWINLAGTVTDYLKPSSLGFELKSSLNAFTLSADMLNMTGDSIIATNRTAWMLGGNTLSAKSFLGSNNAYDVGFERNNVEYFTLDTNGITSLKDITSSGNITLQKGNPRLRLRDTGGSVHTTGFDLHVNGDEFLIDDNTHSRNILRNYLSSSVHYTDLDAEVFNFKNGATNYLNISSAGLNIATISAESTDVDKFLVSNAGLVKFRTGSQLLSDIGAFSTPSGLTANYVPKWNGSAFANSQIFDNGTNVGIGTTSPSATGLDTGVTKLFIVNSNSNYGSTLTTISDSIGRNIRISNQDRTHLGVFDIDTTLRIGTNTATPLLFLINGSERVRIDTSGSVGIGTTSPSYKLDVVGNGGFSGTINANSVGNNIRLKADGTAAKDAFIGNDANGIIYLSNWNADRGWRIAANGNINNLGSGNVGIGTASPSYKLDIAGITRITDASNPLIYFGRGSAVNSGIGMVADDLLRFSVGTSGLVTDTKMVINSNGNVGIGTTTPTSLLHTVGSAPASVTNANGTNALSGISLNGGAGGAVSATTGTVTGGKGSIMRIVGGNGGVVTGTPSVGFGGTGGEIDLIGGNGASGTTFGGNGGYFSGQGGDGGNNGNGGYSALKGGNGGTGNSSGGDVFLVGGIKSGTGTDGNILLGLSPSLVARGNVGVGTASPSDKLSIVANNSIGLNADASSDVSRLNWRYQGIVYSWIERVHSDGAMAFGVQSSERMRISSSGNVGIGTVSPQSTLHLSHSNGVGIEFFPNYSSNVNYIQSYDRTANVYRDFGIKTNSSLGNFLVQASTGNVGIGTTSPSYKLHTIGTTSTTDLNITNGAGVNKYWVCTNATTGAGAWTTLGSAGYLGTWNASTNTPTIANGTGTAGTFYIATTAGTWNSITFAVNDEVWYNGSIWEKVARNFTLTTATASILGGIKIGSGLAIDGSGVVTVSTLNQNTTGSAATLTTARNIAITGDATYTVSFNGSANVTSALTLATVNSNVGTFRSVTVNAKGLVTAATNPTTLSGYGITDAASGLLTGYTSGAGTVAATDTILQAIQKLNGNIASALTTVSLTSNVTGILPIANGGTGSSTKNFVDLTTNQTVAGVKTFSVDAFIGGIRVGSGGGTISTNTAIGGGAGAGNTTGINNIFVGYLTGSNNADGGNNSFIGAYSGVANSGGTDNTFVGTSAGNANTGGSLNTAIGRSALASITTGYNLVAIGYEAGAYRNPSISPGTLATNFNSVFIGSGTKADADGGSNEIVIGYNAQGLGNNSTVIGNPSTTNNHFFGSLKYGTQLKPNNTAGTNGQFLKTNGTQDSWATISTTDISGINTLQTALNGTGLVRMTGTTVSYDNSIYLTAVSLTSNVTGILPIANGGTGSSTKNFVDLSTTQDVGGSKSFTGTTNVQDLFVFGKLYDSVLEEGVSGKFLMSTNTGTEWKSITTSYISNLSSYTGFDARYYTETEIDTLLSGKQASLSGTGFVKISGTTISYDNSTYLTTATAASSYMPLVTGTQAQVLTIDENGNRNFMNIDHKPLKLNANEIAVGNEFGLLESRSEFKYLNSLMSIGHKTDTSKYTSFGMTSPTGPDGLIKVFGGGSLHLDGSSVKINHLGSSTIFERIVTVDQNGYLSAKVLEASGNISQGLDSVLGISNLSTNRSIILNSTSDSFTSAIDFNFNNDLGVRFAYFTELGSDGICSLSATGNVEMNILSVNGDIGVISQTGDLTLSGGTNTFIGVGNTTSKIVLNGTSFKLNLGNTFSGASNWGNTGLSSTPQDGDMVLFTYDNSKGAFVLNRVQKRTGAYDTGKTYLTLID